MASILSTPKQRLVQVLHSLPHYAWEVMHPSPSHSLVEWLRYKVPTRFKRSALPRKLTLEITNHCNLSCPHCFREVMERPLGFMQRDLVRKVAAQLQDVPYCELKIVGLGEPALHPQFEEVLEILRPVAPKSALYTNGVVFMKIAAEALIEGGIRLIVVSIDGTDRESFDKHRPGGDYDQLWKDVERFREVADTVKFNYLLPMKREEQLGARPFKGCRDIYREMYVEWDGKVPLCGYVALQRDAIWIGNAADTPLMELWKHPELDQMRAHHENRNDSEISFCRNCKGS